MLIDAGKFCPACKMLNDSIATKCGHCGAPFEWVINTKESTTHQVAETSYLTTDGNSIGIDMELNKPENGVAIYLANGKQPFTVRYEDDFIIGRKIDESLDNLVDLSPFDALTLGISRRHIRIQRLENGYQITDLNSTNGTRFNGKRLTPGQPAPLPNPVELQLGKMSLYIIYQLKIPATSINPQK
jgi:hypothetical protein